MKHVLVAGAGTMGTSLAQLFAQSGFSVVLYNRRQPSLDAAKGRIGRSLEKSVSKGKMTGEERDEVLKRIRFSVDLQAAVASDLVLESIAENMEAKRAFFTAADEICGPETLFATNTSSLSVTEIAACTARPDRVIGMHFFNPPTVMRLLELVVGHETAEETYAAALAVGERLGKVTVRSMDKGGFIVNRLVDPFINEAVYLVEEHVATPEDIDNGCKFGLNHPMGPLALGDMIGWDIMLAVMEVLYREFGDPKYRPAPLMRRMVRAGHLGVKTGKGFYEYK